MLFHNPHLLYEYARAHQRELLDEAARLRAEQAIRARRSRARLAPAAATAPISPAAAICAICGARLEAAPRAAGIGG